MNKDRRASIQAVIDQLEEARQELETLRDEEQEYFDNMPENLQGGEKGEMAQTAIDNLDEAISNIEAAIDSANSATE